ncbi:class I SAM-dependent methyltransferase [Roseateles sp. BYS180W]|uniref:Class I SAM-dependent methyltransferase n=1 Tax=Roseateles rivi TaxID=3299028 RepID=A0ABW7FU82_9BURK
MPPPTAVPEPSTAPIRFNDGSEYERYMGAWSTEVGRQFLDWLAPAAGQRWLDVGCGSGAFTAWVAQHAAPAALHGVDPSDAQLVYARQRTLQPPAQWALGDAMALPYAAAQFDQAVMPLVIFFVPEPARGVAEMVRVLAPGGWASAYAWDMAGGGFPYHLAQQLLRELGCPVVLPPSPEASDLPTLQALWTQAGLTQVQTTVFTVQRRYASVEDYWQTLLCSPSLSAELKALTPPQLKDLQARLRERLPLQADGSVLCSARAHAVKGRKG